MKIRYIEHWVQSIVGNTIVTEQNPCGCHPDDYIIENHNFGYKNAIVSISFKNRKHFLRHMKSYKYEKLK